MPSISKDQQDHCKLAQLSQAFKVEMTEGSILERILLEIDNVNLKILSNKASNGSLIGGTPLHIASYYKHSKGFEALLRRGADFTAKNKNGSTAVFHSTAPRFCESDETIGTLQNALVQSALKMHVKFGNTENPCSAEGLSHFHIACAANHLEAVQLFLNSGVSVDGSTNVDSSIFPGYTPLHFAARFCGYATAKLLLKWGANISMKDAKGLTPLHVLVERNLIIIQLKRRKGSKDLEQSNKYMAENEKMIKLLLENNRIADVDSIGYSKLHAACTLSDTSLANSYLKDFDINCSIHVDSPIWPGYTALHFAIQFNVDIVKLLLKNGADIEAKDSKGVTPFDLCVELLGVDKLYDILSTTPPFKDILFSDYKTRLADFICAIRSPFTLEKFFKSLPTGLYLPKNCPVWPGYCLSHLAVLFSKPDPDHKQTTKAVGFCPAETYLECGGNAIIQDAHGRTPLHLAYYQKKTTIIDLFFERQFGVADAIDTDGLSHLHIACKRRNIEAVRILLSTSVDVNGVYKGKAITSRFVRLASGSTPLHIAMEKSNIEIIKILLEHGANVNLIDADGMTPLHRFTHLPPYLTQSKENVIKEIGHLLISACNLKNIICSKTGLSHLHFASYAGNADAVERLLELGADPNAIFLCNRNIESPQCSARCSSGFTPLHFAIENKDTKVIELLLRSGADIFAKKPNRMTLFYDIISNGLGFMKIGEIDINIKKAFTAMLGNDVALQKRALDDSGLTPLHAACFLGDVDQIQRLLNDSRVDVNAQMHDDSPIWPNSTPLHLLIESTYDIKDLEYTMKLLLNSGANITQMDSENDTPVHKTWGNQKIDPGRHLLRLLLGHQTDFSINPVNKEGVSHFHLACAVSEYTIVERFLENGIDVNLPIDYQHYLITFQTPLQYMLRSKVSNAIDTEWLSKTMDVLLKYGADVNARDENGSTPLLEAALFRPWRKLFFLKLYKAGADANCTDIYGRSVLEILLYSVDLITNEELQILLANRNLFNTFNLFNGIGIISRITDREPLFPNRKVILKAMIKNPSLFTINSFGQTPIHNIVACPKTTISAAEYINYVERFIKLGFNINAKDSTGETALHIAAHFHNEKAIRGLLIAGADISVTNMYNQTLFDKLFEFRKRWYNFILIRRTKRLRLNNRLVFYIIAMQQCGLEVSSENLTWANEELSRHKLQLLREKILKELEDTKLVKIGTGSLTLRDFLSETGAVASRPSMICDADREAINKFFKSIDYKRFPHLKYLFKLQYRKMLERLTLMDAATHSVREILGNANGFSMPENCCRMILRFLSNTDVKHLILSLLAN